MRLAGRSRFDRHVTEPRPFDWAVFERELEAELRMALGGLAPLGRTFRAMSLYGMHHERDGLLALPMLAADEADDDEAAAAAAAEGPATFYGDRFTPDAWSHPEVLLEPARALALERALTAFEPCQRLEP